MVIQRGEIWWANLPEPNGSAPGFRRLVLIIQSDRFNQSRINTAVAAILTTNTNYANAVGNVLLTTEQSQLSKDSVVKVTQLFTIDESFLFEYVSTLSETKMAQVDKGLRLVLAI